MTKGFLVVDKPSGVSSNQVVGKVKKAIGTKRVGHAGTLDPMATGVLVLALGKVTRLIRFIQDQEKEYVATALFGGWFVPWDLILMSVGIGLVVYLGAALAAGALYAEEAAAARGDR